MWLWRFCNCFFFVVHSYFPHKLTAFYFIGFWYRSFIFLFGKTFHKFQLSICYGVCFFRLVLQLSRTLFNIIWEKILIKNFSFFADSVNLLNGQNLLGFTKLHFLTMFSCLLNLKVELVWEKIDRSKEKHLYLPFY